jgi:hypothetical protein
VLSALPVNSTPRVITGTAQRASTLITNQGVWTGVGNAYTYQWQHSTDGLTWTNVARATMTSYTLTAADEGSYLRMLVTATNPDGTGTAVSAPTALVPSSPPQCTAAPVVGGAAVRGSTLTASQGSWSGIGNTFAYQWQRDTGIGFTDIPGATDANYTLAVADEAPTFACA